MTKIHRCDAIFDLLYEGMISANHFRGDQFMRRDRHPSHNPVYAVCMLCLFIISLYTVYTIQQVFFL